MEQLDYNLLYRWFVELWRGYSRTLERYVESTKKLYQKYPEKNDLESLETLADAYARSEKLGEAASWGCLMLNTITANEGVSSEFHSKIEEFRTLAIEKIEALLRASCAKGEIADRSKIVVHGRNLSS